jgi:hypothetical protein
MTVSASAVAAIQAAAAGAYQGAGLGGPPFHDGNSFVTIVRDQTVIAAHAGGSVIASSVAQMVASGTLASYGRLAHTRYYAPGGIQSWV